MDDAEVDSVDEEEQEAFNRHRGSLMLKAISATVKKLAETIHNIVEGVISANDEAREKTIHLCAKLYRAQVKILKGLLNLRVEEIEPMLKSLLTLTAEKLTPSIHTFLTKV